MASGYNLSRIDGPGVQGNIVVGTTAVEVKVGASPLEARKLVSIQPTSSKVYFGYTSSVTVSTGTQLFKNQTVWLDASDQLTIYVIASNAGQDVRVTEIS